ncbi:MAG: hypothetical protein DCF32_22670, partial [Leptolyngbya sp.]
SQIDLESFPYIRLGLAIAPLDRLISLALTCGGLALILGLGFGTVAALLLSPFSLGSVGFGGAGAVGAVIGWSLGLLGLLQGGLPGAAQTRQTPNQDMTLALRNTVVLVAVLGAILGLLLVLPAVVAGRPPLTLLPLSRLRLIVGCLVILALWLSFGLQHGLVRLLLAGKQGLPLAGRPWLETMVAAGLLRRLGGGYSFGHEELRQAIIPEKTGSDR